MTQLADNTAPEAQPHKNFKQALRPILLVVVPLVVALAGGEYFVSTLNSVSTDNAYARVAKTAINARVSGQVVNIAVVDNEQVRKGQVLFQINPEPLQLAVERTQAQLNVARLRIEGLKTHYREQLAELQSARELADFEQKDFARKKALVANQFVSQSLYERADTDLKVARQHIASLQQQVANTLVALNGDPNIDVNNHPAVREAKSQLDEAKLYLSYATVSAPEEGIVTKVDDLQVGNFISSGAPAFALLSKKHVWIEANFRETQINHMHAGQHATVHIDSYPNRSFDAHVVSLSPGAGSDFSLLPPENASGNWVKVVQRVPVRLELDDTATQVPLFSGTSATVKVETGARTGWAELLAKILSWNAQP